MTAGRRRARRAGAAALAACLTVCLAVCLAAREGAAQAAPAPRRAATHADLVALFTDAAHVRAALARFDQVGGITDADRDLAFANLQKAAAHYGVALVEGRWQDLGRRPHTPNPARG